MATCDMGYEHADAEPVIVDTSGEAVAAEADAVAEIEVARINAERDVEVAKIEAKHANADDAATMAALMARIEVLEAALAPPAPEPEPEPVVIPVPDPEPVNDDSDSLPDIPRAPKGGKDKGWWGGYGR